MISTAWVFNSIADITQLPLSFFTGLFGMNVSYQSLVWNKMLIIAEGKGDLDWKVYDWVLFGHNV
jgi:hypothetical protein